VFLLLALAACTGPDQEQLGSGEDDGDTEPIRDDTDPGDSDTPTDTDADTDSTSDAHREIDVLFVLDDSCSMAAERDALLANLDALIDPLETSGVDWRIGVIDAISEDPRTAGRLRAVAGERWAERRGPLPGSILLGLLGRNDSSAGVEDGFATALLALDQTTPEVQDANAGFLRSCAALHVVVYSDEPPPEESSPTPLLDFLDDYATTQAAPATFSAIVPPSAGCGTEGASGSNAYRVAGADSGVWGSICTGDVRTSLSSVAAHLLAGAPACAVTPVEDHPVLGSTSLDGTWEGSFSYTEVTPLAENPHCESTVSLVVDGSATRHVVLQGSCTDWDPNYSLPSVPGDESFGPMALLGFAELASASATQVRLDLSMRATGLVGQDIRVVLRPADRSLAGSYDVVTGTPPFRFGQRLDLTLQRP
jgi:hypothetical protein